MKKKILFVTGIESPFWVEFAHKFNMHSDMEITLMFCETSLHDRGKHWNVGQTSSILCFNGANFGLWFDAVVKNLSPDLILVGGYRSDYSVRAAYIAKKFGIKLGFIVEQLEPKNIVLDSLRKNIFSFVSSALKPDLILAVGHRAIDQYSDVTGALVSLFPYHQSLPVCHRIRDARKKPVEFLFSGRLIKRNSVSEMLKAVQMLCGSHPSQFRWIISGHGPEEKIIRKSMKGSAELRSHIEFDRDFISWSDRIRPFMRSDMLLCPAKHSGWGLVIPEALATGLPVITTRKVESARYFVDDYVNGIVIRPTVIELYESLRYVVENRDVITHLSMNASNFVARGDVEYGVRRIAGLFRRVLN